MNSREQNFTDSIYCVIIKTHFFFIQLEKNKNDAYYNYFKDLALKGTGEKEKTNKKFKNIVNENFSCSELAIVKKLAKEQLRNA